MRSSSTTPTSNKRNTRSNSQNDLTFDNIKILIENSKKEIISSVKDELKCLREMIDSLTSRVIRLERDNEALIKNYQEDVREKQAAQSQELELLKQSIETKSVELSPQILDEVENRLNRRTNLIVRGLPELQTGSLVERKAHDQEKVRELLHFLSQDPSVAGANVTRIGRLRPNGHRLIKLEVSSEGTKRDLLRGAKRLKTSPSFAKVYISPDLTPQQQQIQKQLQQQLKVRRENGEDVFIRSGRVQPRHQNSNFQ